jgi:hypothetical protein
MVAKWNPQEDSHKYDLESIFLLDVLYYANRFMILNPQLRGLFEGQKGRKKKKSKTSQKIQRI